MGYRPPPGFTWPVPPEELSGVPMLVLDWTAEGRLVVRQESDELAPGSGAPVPAEAPLELDGAAVVAPVAAPRPHVTDTTPAIVGGSFARPAVRERVAWLGVGTLLGLVLAVSTLPDTGTTPAPPADADPVAVAPMASATLVSARGESHLAEALTPATPQPRPATVEPAPSPQPHALVTRPVAAVPASLRTSPTRAAESTEARHPTPRAPVAQAVLREIHRYEAALSRLDATAVQAVWPDADRRALVTEFTSLREQRLRLERCTVEMPGEAAAVTCRGTLAYRPRVGDHTTRTRRGLWRFTLARDSGGWVIEDVRAPAAP